jgi:hypothetical protein
MPPPVEHAAKPATIANIAVTPTPVRAMILIERRLNSIISGTRFTSRQLP